MRIAVLGTPDFAVPTLDALVSAGHEVALVVAQPDRPAGRGQQLKAPPLAQRAFALGLSLAQPKALRSGPFPDRFVGLAVDVAVVVAYGRILPSRLLQAPRFGCVNLHASLLPRWRGAAPIQRAIQAGDAVTGVCAQQMVEALDEGPLLHQLTMAIHDDDTAGSLHDRLSLLAARVAVEVLATLPQCEAVAQTGAVTWAPPLAKGEGAVDFDGDAVVIGQHIRAMTPWPGGYLPRPEGPLKLVRVHPCAGSGPAGTVLVVAPLTVACGSGALRLDQVIPAGRKPMTGEAWANGERLRVGERLYVRG